MAVVLGAGDAFHLVPRAIALCTTGLENYTAALGIGKLVTSVTMTLFYVLLYYVWRARYQVSGKTGTTAAVWLLALARIARYILEEGVRPALVVGMPVGFVNVVESKELLGRCPVPQIVLEGRRGGSALAVTTLHAVMESA